MTYAKKPATLRRSCGKITGYNTHVNHGEYPCKPCSDARRALSVRYRVKYGLNKYARIDFPTAAALLRGPQAALVRAAIGDVTADAILEFNPADDREQPS